MATPGFPRSNRHQGPVFRNKGAFLGVLCRLNRRSKPIGMSEPSRLPNRQITFRCNGQFAKQVSFRGYCDAPSKGRRARGPVRDIRFNGPKNYRRRRRITNNDPIANAIGKVAGSGIAA